MVSESGLLDILPDQSSKKARSEGLYFEQGTVDLLRFPVFTDKPCPEERHNLGPVPGRVQLPVLLGPGVLDRTPPGPVRQAAVRASQREGDQHPDISALRYELQAGDRERPEPG